jgi:hypothetical protein
MQPGSSTVDHLTGAPVLKVYLLIMVHWLTDLVSELKTAIFGRGCWIDRFVNQNLVRGVSYWSQYKKRHSYRVDARSTVSVTTKGTT